MLRRLALIIPGLVLAVFALEGVLQLLALCFGGSRLATAASDTTRILCLGDSHTFGVYFPPEQSYPHQLEQILNHGLERPQYAVINAGVPGSNTASMLRALPGLLDRYHPQMVIVLGGINDRWSNVAIEELLPTQPPSWWQERIAKSRLARLCRIAWSRLFDERDASLSDPEIAPEYRPPPAEQGVADDDARSITAHCLQRIVELCKNAGATPILLTYAANQLAFRASQLGIRDAAARTSTLLIDLQTQFRELATQGNSDLLIDGDWHPTPSGYQVIAAAIAKQLVQVKLVARGALTPLTTPRTVESSALTVKLEGVLGRDGKTMVQALVLAGEPHSAFRVLLANATTPPLRLFRTVIPLRRDAMFAASLKMRPLAGWLDEHGRATIKLNAAPFSRFGANPVFACAVTLRDDGTQRHHSLSVLSVSPAIRIKG